MFECSLRLELSVVAAGGIIVVEGDWAELSAIIEEFDWLIKAVGIVDTTEEKGSEVAVAVSEETVVGWVSVKEGITEASVVAEKELEAGETGIERVVESPGTGTTGIERVVESPLTGITGVTEKGSETPVVGVKGVERVVGVTEKGSETPVAREAGIEKWLEAPLAGTAGIERVSEKCSEAPESPLTGTERVAEKGSLVPELPLAGTAREA